MNYTTVQYATSWRLTLSPSKSFFYDCESLRKRDKANETNKTKMLSMQSRNVYAPLSPLLLKPTEGTIHPVWWPSTWSRHSTSPGQVNIDKISNTLTTTVTRFTQIEKQQLLIVIVASECFNGYTLSRHERTNSEHQSLQT